MWGWGCAVKRLVLSGLIAAVLAVPVSTSIASAAGALPSSWTVSVDFSESVTGANVAGTTTLKATFKCDDPPPTSGIFLSCPTLVSVDASQHSQQLGVDCPLSFSYDTVDSVNDFPTVDLIPTSLGSDTYTYSPPVVSVHLSGTTEDSCGGSHPSGTIVDNRCPAVGCGPPLQQATLGVVGPVTVAGTFPFTVSPGSGTTTVTGTSSWTIIGDIDCAAASGAGISAAASGAEISAATSDAGTCCPPAKVAFPPVRNADTPKGMPDRIPPRVATPLQVQANIPNCRNVFVMADGPSNAGTALVEGKKAATLPTGTNPSMPLSVEGDEQTGTGIGAKLFLVAIDNTDPVHPIPIATSHPFAVSAIPVNWHSAVFADVDPISSFFLCPDGGVVGIVTHDTWASDSDDPNDLDAVQVTEVVQITIGPRAVLTGAFFAGKDASVDDCIADNPTIVTPGIYSASNQAHAFIDGRSTTATPTNFNPGQVFAIPNSGYTITERGDTNGGKKGKLKGLTIIRTGANLSNVTGTIGATGVQVTVSTSAGSTTPATGINEPLKLKK
jgi:hypothetical protein